MMAENDSMPTVFLKCCDSSGWGGLIGKIVAAVLSMGSIVDESVGERR